LQNQREDSNCWFSLSCCEKVNPELLSEKTQTRILIAGCRELPDILFDQVSGLYGIPYSSHTSKCSTQINRAQYGNVTLVPVQMGTNMASGIHFCYKRQSDHSHEQVNIHINTSCKTSTVQIVKNHKMRNFLSIRDSLLAAILMSCGTKLRNSKLCILKTTDAIELKTFNKIYFNDV
jgi:hypothetical protein